MSLRDTQIVVLETNRDTIRIGLGLHEFLKAPAFVRFVASGIDKHLTNCWQEISARVGIPRALLESDGPSSPKVSDYLVGPQLDQAIATGQDLSISWPFVEAQIGDWTQAEAIWCVHSEFLASL